MLRLLVIVVSGGAYGVAMAKFGVDYTNPAFYVGLVYGFAMSMATLLEKHR